MVLKRSSTLTRKSLSRKTSLKKVGERGQKYQDLRNAKFERDKDDEGLIRCQDYKIGLPACGIARSEMDLHHTEGRDGELLFDESKMVWLTRECHNEAHN